METSYPSLRLVPLGKEMKGLIYVAPEGIDSDEELGDWLNKAVEFVKSLPPKKLK